MPKEEFTAKLPTRISSNVYFDKQGAYVVSLPSVDVANTQHEAAIGYRYVMYVDIAAQQREVNKRSK